MYMSVLVCTYGTYVGASFLLPQHRFQGLNRSSGLMANVFTGWPSSESLLSETRSYCVAQAAQNFGGYPPAPVTISE